MQCLPHNKLEELLSAFREVLVEPGEASRVRLQAADRLLGEMRGELSRILEEHAGMADELLRAYEQLGVVFEITRKLPVVHTEQEVVRLFVDSLRATYQDYCVAMVRWNCQGVMEAEGGDWVMCPAVREVVQRAAAGRSVVVDSLAVPAEGLDRILAAPVFAGKECVCAIVMARGVGEVEPSSGGCFQASDMSLIDALVQFCGDLIRNQRLSLELRWLSMDLVRALVSAIDQKDSYTSGHSERVGLFSRLLGCELGLNEEDLQMLEWAALLHDIGKIGIRDDVLRKPGRLTEEEFRHIKEHPVRGFEVARQVDKLQTALAGIRHHHERFDGRGYPDGLAGEAIPLQARIVQVADIFDALTTTRSYRGAYRWEQALEILRAEAGQTVDPKLLQIFERLIRREIAAGRLTFESAGPPAGQSGHGTPEAQPCAAATGCSSPA